MSRFTSRDLTDLYISESFQSVLQIYDSGSNKVYMLDGTGSRIFNIPTYGDNYTIVLQESASQNLVITGSLIVTGSANIIGTLTADIFRGTLVSSSIIYDSGSTVFGDTVDDFHNRTGSMNISGSITVTGSSNFQIVSASNIFISESLVTHHIDFTDDTLPSYLEGRLYYDSNDKTLAMYASETDVALQIGQEEWVRVVNKTSDTITNGTVVYLAGTFGNRPTVERTDTNNHASSSVLGVATHDILADQEGYVTTHGLVRGINTTAYSAGDTLYTSGSNGKISNVKLASPQHCNAIGKALNSTNNGIIYVNPSPDLVFTDLHNVTLEISSSDGNLIVWDSTNALWSGSNSRGVTLGNNQLVMQGLVTSGSHYHNIITVTNDYTIQSSTYTLLCSASSALTVTLPNASEKGRVLNIKKTDGSNNQVIITGSQNIDNSNNLIITEPYAAITLQSDGTQWWIF